LEETLMLIINVACMQESKFQVQMLNFFLDNGNSKLNHALVSNKETTIGLLDIICKDVLKDINYQ
jgi:hypothetical protein